MKNAYSNTLSVHRRKSAFSRITEHFLGVYLIVTGLVNDLGQRVL